jgi:enterochelin esterase family protein
MMKFCQMLAMTIFLCVPLMAQEAGTTSPSTTGGMVTAAKLKSPEILPDNRVTFRLYSPGANEVTVIGNFPGGRGLAMVKDSSGVWSVTASSLKSDLWAYTFSIDGVRSLDPNNYNVVRDGTGFMNTLLILDEQSKVLQPQQVPHGTVSTVWVPSTLAQTPRRLYIYTPAGYDENRNTRYPVLYLLHGSGGDEDAWPSMGVAPVILDNLIAAGKAKPMIVVMPDAYWWQIATLDLGGPRAYPAPGVGGSVSGLPTDKDYTKSDRDIVGDIVPFIDQHYRTLADAYDRAIAGLSMGSEITANVGIKHPEVFGSVALLSAGMFRKTPTSPGGTAVLDKINAAFLGQPAETNKKMRLLFFSCGTEDPRLPALQQLWLDLESKQIRFVSKTYSGEHEWRVWRHSLVDLAPILFR